MTKNFVMITDKTIKEIDLNNEYVFYDKEDCECVCNLLNMKDEKIRQLKEEKKELQSKAKTLLDFYSKRYGDAIFNGQRHSKTLREELWIVKEVLSKLGLYEDE